MRDKISSILYNECKLNPYDLVLIGFSGGPDSLCLLHVLCQIGQPTIAVHINHHMRPESDEEVHIVKQLARDMNVEFMSLEADVPAYANEQSLSIEEAARTRRYTLLFEAAERVGAKAVAVAHTADDQTETVLMHLLRGTGLVGLRGMEFRTFPSSWSHTIALLRPLLSTWRKEIQNYLEEQGLKPIVDRSNMDISFLRNRIRHELLPLLEGYNLSIREVVYRMSRTISDDYSLLQELTDRAWEFTLLQKGSGYLEFNTASFLQQPLAIQRYLLRKAISFHLPGLRDVGFECIERGIMLLSGQIPGSQTNLVAGLRLIKEGDKFWLATWQADLLGADFPALQAGEQMSLKIPSRHTLNDGWQLEIEEITNLDMTAIQNEARLDPFQAWIDLRNLETPLIARVRRPADQIRPMGLDGHSIKISDVMINQKFPRRARHTWPLICSGNEIVWVPGYRASHTARIMPNTLTALHLRLSRCTTT